MRSGKNCSHATEPPKKLAALTGELSKKLAALNLDHKKEFQKLQYIKSRLRPFEMSTLYLWSSPGDQCASGTWHVSPKQLLKMLSLPREGKSLLVIMDRLVVDTQVFLTYPSSIGRLLPKLLEWSSDSLTIMTPDTAPVFSCSMISDALIRPFLTLVSKAKFLSLHRVDDFPLASLIHGPDEVVLDCVSFDIGGMGSRYDLPNRMPPAPHSPLMEICARNMHPTHLGAFSTALRSNDPWAATDTPPEVVELAFPAFNILPPPVTHIGKLTLQIDACDPDMVHVSRCLLGASSRTLKDLTLEFHGFSHVAQVSQLSELSLGEIVLESLSISVPIQVAICYDNGNILNKGSEHFLNPTVFHPSVSRSTLEVDPLDFVTLILSLLIPMNSAVSPNYLSISMEHFLFPVDLPLVGSHAFGRWDILAAFLSQRFPPSVIPLQLRLIPTVDTSTRALKCWDDLDVNEAFQDYEENVMTAALREMQRLPWIQPLFN